MAEDKTGWSEKGKRTDGADGEKGSSTPSRPSKRQTDSSGKGSGDSSVVRTPSSDGARKVAKAAATAGQRDVSFASRLGFPALVALICLLGIGVVVFARSSREALAQPALGDHWHAVYGVYNCNATGEGDAKYLPPFESAQDFSGIHSHGDGLFHIHPFVEAATGPRAQMRHFFDEMQVEVDETQIVVQNGIDNPQNLQAGEPCADGTGNAEIKVLRWQFSFEALADDRPDPEVIEGDPGQVNFSNDREVFIIAYMGENTDISEIPLPPQDRFNTLNNVSNVEEYNPTQLNPVDSGSTGIEVEVGDDAGADTDADE